MRGLFEVRADATLNGNWTPEAAEREFFPLKYECLYNCKSREEVVEMAAAQFADGIVDGAYESLTFRCLDEEEARKVKEITVPVLMKRTRSAGPVDAGPECDDDYIREEKLNLTTVRFCGRRSNVNSKAK